MADKLEVELKLQDQVAGPAKKAADALRGVEKQADKTQAALSKGAQKAAKEAEKTAAKIKEALSFDKQVAKANAAFAKLKADPHGFAELLKIRREIAETSKSAGATSWAGTAAEEFAEKLKGALALAAIGELVFKGAEKVIDLWKEGVSKAFEEGGKEETRRLAFRLSLGQKEGKEVQEDIERMAKLTQFTRVEASNLFLPLRRAGFSERGATAAFAAAGDVQAGGGLSAQESVEKFTKIKNRGGITKKELLALNINAPDFYAALGKEFKKIAAKAAEKKAAETGGFPAGVLLNRIYKGIEKKQGGILGTGAGLASKTLEVQLKKLRDLPDEFFAKLVDSPQWPKITGKFSALLEQLDPDSDNGKKILTSLFGAFDKLGDLLSTALKPESIDAFVQGMKGLVDVVGSVSTGLKEVINLITGETISKAFHSNNSDAVNRIEAQRKAMNAFGDLEQLQAAGLKAGQGDEYARKQAEKLGPADLEDLAKLNPEVYGAHGARVNHGQKSRVSTTYITNSFSGVGDIGKSNQIQSQAYSDYNQSFTQSGELGMSQSGTP